MNVGGTFRFLCTDDTQPEGIVEVAHFVRAILPLLGLGFALHVSEIVNVIQHRIGCLQILLQMMPRSAQGGADVAKAFQLFIAGKAGGGIEVAIEPKEVLHGMQILRSAQPTMHHLAASILSAGLCVNELLLDPGEQSPSLIISGLLLLRRWHLAELKLMQHLLPTLRDGNVGAYLQRQIIEPTITLLHVTIVAVEAIARKEGVGFESGCVLSTERDAQKTEEG